MRVTTLNKIRKHEPCLSGWATLLKGLGKTGPDDEPLPVVRVLEINGLDDALWCLRTLEGADREIRLFAVGCARQVQHLMLDPRSLAVLEVAERFANGRATRQELSTSCTAARDAAEEAWEAVYAASAAAYAAYATNAAADAAYEASDTDDAASTAYATYATNATDDAASAARAAALTKQEQLFKEYF